METQLLIGIYRDVDNFTLLEEKTNKIKFSIDEYQKLYEVAKILYNKQHYTYIDEFSLKTYLDTIHLDEKRKKDCITSYQAMKEFDMSDLKMDFVGVLEQYTKVVIPLRLFNLVDRNGGLDTFCSTLLKIENSEDLTSYLEGSIGEITSVGQQDSNMIESNLTSCVTEEFKLKTREGNQIDKVPFMPEYKYLNRYLQGIVRGVNGIAGSSGTGKSSMLVTLHILSILENSEDKICLFCNEQVKEVFIYTLTFAYITNVFSLMENNVLLLSRDELSANFFTKEQYDYFFKAMDSWTEKYKNRITHVYFESMQPYILRREVKKKYRQGFKHFVYDTFKSDEEEYKDIIMLSKVMDNLTKRYPITFTITLQISGESIGTKYLTSKNLARAKAIKEILENLILFRRLATEELGNLVVKTFDETHKKEINVPLDLQNRNYFALFVDKNRNGKDGFVLLYEIDLDLLCYVEKGVITNMPKDYLRK